MLVQVRTLGHSPVIASCMDKEEPHGQMQRHISLVRCYIPALDLLLGTLGGASFV